MLAVVDSLAAQFPDVPLSEVYVKVGDARVAAARRLPNVLAYRDVLEHEARSQLELMVRQDGERFCDGRQHRTAGSP
jgi:hypothetical protein